MSIGSDNERVPRPPKLAEHFRIRNQPDNIQRINQASSVRSSVILNPNTKGNYAFRGKKYIRLFDERFLHRMVSRSGSAIQRNFRSSQSNHAILCKRIDNGRRNTSANAIARMKDRCAAVTLLRRRCGITGMEYRKYFDLPN